MRLCLGMLLLAATGHQQSTTSNEILEAPPHLKAKPVNVYWNIPTFQCDYHKLNFSGLAAKYNIIQNKDDRFRGANLVILYDPGDFPAILMDGSDTVYRNGGVPQEGNLTKHLKLIQSLVDELIPQEDFSGIGIIDFESWRPIFRQNFGILSKYIDYSIAIEKKKHPKWSPSWLKKEATKRFEASAKQFMEETLLIAKYMRPRATWGYYAYPYCFNMASNRVTRECPDNVKAENDRTEWLFNLADNFYPSLYVNQQMLNLEQRVQMIEGRIDEAFRIAKQLDNTPYPQIVPYFWYNYQDTHKFVSKEELFTIFTAIASSPVDGFVIWGSSNDVNNKNKCFQLYQFIDDTMGPLLLHIFSNGL